MDATLIDQFVQLLAGAADTECEVLLYVTRGMAGKMAISTRWATSRTSALRGDSLMSSSGWPIRMMLSSLSNPSSNWSRMREVVEGLGRDRVGLFDDHDMTVAGGV